jgi:hypothetical protein
MSVYQRPPNYYFLPKAQQEEIDRKIYEQKVADGVLDVSGMFSYNPETRRENVLAYDPDEKPKSGSTPVGGVSANISQMVKNQEELERAEREEIYFNEQRTGMGSSGTLAPQGFTVSPTDLIDDSLNRTSFFDEANRAEGDTRLWDEIKEDFISGETEGPSAYNPYIGEQEKYKDSIYDFIYGEDYSSLSSAEQRLGLTDGTFTYGRPTNFQNAKDQADSYYIQSLERSLEKATTDEEKESIQKLIDKGAPDFDTLEDIQNYDDLWSYRRGLQKDGKLEQAGFDLKLEEYNALSMQEAIMGDYMIANERPKIGDAAHAYFQEDPDALSYMDFKPFESGHVFLNTGTAYNRIPSSNLIKEDGTIGQVGGYSYILPEIEGMSTFEKNTGIAFDIISAIYPPAAPILQFSKTFMQTEGDLEESLKVGGTAYVKGKVNDITKDKILDAYEAADIPVRDLDPYTQSKIVDVTNDILAGKSGTDSAIDAGKSLLWREIKDEAGISFEDFESKFDFNLPDFGLSGLDIDLPDIDLPDVDLDLPDIDLPDVDLPDIDLPDVDLDLPDVDLDLPDVDLDLPDIDLNVPDVDLSGNLPDFDLDLPDVNIDTPNIETPDIDLPSIDLPSLNLALRQAEKEEEEETEVEQLFNKELFKYDTQVKYTQGLLSPKLNLRKFG